MDMEFPAPYWAQLSLFEKFRFANSMKPVKGFINRWKLAKVVADYDAEYDNYCLDAYESNS